MAAKLKHNLIHNIIARLSSGTAPSTANCAILVGIIAEYTVSRVKQQYNSDIVFSRAYLILFERSNNKSSHHEKR